MRAMSASIRLNAARDRERVNLLIQRVPQPLRFIKIKADTRRDLMGQFALELISAGGDQHQLDQPPDRPVCRMAINQANGNVLGVFNFGDGLIRHHTVFHGLAAGAAAAQYMHSPTRDGRQ